MPGTLIFEAISDHLHTIIDSVKIILERTPPELAADIVANGVYAVSYTHLDVYKRQPIKPPYAVYFQGGLTWPHAKFGILMSLQKLIDAGVVRL